MQEEEEWATVQAVLEEGGECAPFPKDSPPFLGYVVN